MFFFKFPFFFDYCAFLLIPITDIYILYEDNIVKNRIRNIYKSNQCI